MLDENRLARIAVKLAVNTRKTEGCWFWTGYTQPNGYGWLNVAGLKIAAHRAALLVTGVIPPVGMDVCHHCDVRNCVRPDHLYVGSRRQNMADCTTRRRHNKPVGAAHWSAKLSDDAVREIRRRHSLGERQESIATSFDINAATVSRVARRVWRAEVA
jgi:hypothetical protein